MNTAAGRDNRAHLLAVAARLFAQQGYPATAMADLERATGLGRSSLYHYFRNKEELLFEITTRICGSWWSRGARCSMRPWRPRYGCDAFRGS